MPNLKAQILLDTVSCFSVLLGVVCFLGCFEFVEEAFSGYNMFSVDMFGLLERFWKCYHNNYYYYDCCYFSDVGFGRVVRRVVLQGAVNPKP